MAGAAGIRRFLTPGWVLLHVFTVAVVITMVLLGRWQLIVSDRKHFNLQNFGYAIQWWLFSVFALYLWWRFVRDALRADDDGVVPTAAADPAATPAEPATVSIGTSTSGEPVTYRRYVMPTASQVAAQAEDEVHSSYNDYLRALNEKASAD